MSISGVSPATANILSGLLNTGSSSSSGSSSGSSSAPTSSTGTSNLSALAQYDLQKIQLSQGSLTAYTQFNSTLGSVQNALIGVMTAPFATALSGITSSNTGVAYISPSAGTNLAVNVTQLAQQQKIKTGLTTTNTTTDPTFSKTTTEVYQTGTLSLQLGTVDTTNSKFTAAGSSTTINITDGSLQGIATAINNAKTGVTASVVQDSTGNGNYQIQLTGPDSGAANGFIITGTDTGGTGNSLSTLNYGTTLATNNTNYSGTNTVGQDASYTVNGSVFTSPTNQDVPVAPGVNISLLKVGSTIISQPQAPTAVTNAANSLVSTLNGVFQVLGQFTASGGPLANDPSTVILFQNEVQLALNSPYGSGNTQLLSQLGISKQPDGTYGVDTNTLSAAYQLNQNGVTDVLSKVSSALMQVVQNYTGTYGQVTQKISYYQNQISIYTGQFQIDQNTAASANNQARSAVQAYNLLAGATGGAISPYTSSV